MKKFRQKSFTNIIQGAKELVKRSPILPISTLSLGVSSANLALNQKRKKQDTEYQKEQLEAMRHLTDSLNKVDKTIEKTTKVQQSQPQKKKKRKYEADDSFVRIGNIRLFSTNNKMIVFKRKDFSILSDTIKGASIGASLGTFGSVFVPKKLKKLSLKGKEHENYTELNKNNQRFNRFRKKYNDIDPKLQKFAVIGASTIIGAALGALVGLVKEGDKFVSRTNVDKRLMSTVVDNLKKQSFKEGQDFTRDPKTADQLKTKVCIVITKYSGDLRVLINTISDRKLNSLTNQTIKNLQNTSVITKKASNNYNEITISTISDGSADAGLITGICEKFIHSGYPVYLVEVG